MDLGREKLGIWGIIKFSLEIQVGLTRFGYKLIEKGGFGLRLNPTRTRIRTIFYL